MDFQEEFYKERLRFIHESRNEREENFEKIQQDGREKTIIYMENHSSAVDHQFRIEQGASVKLSQQKDIDIFTEERDKLVKDLEDPKAELIKMRYEEVVWKNIGGIRIDTSDQIPVEEFDLKYPKMKKNVDYTQS